MAKVTLHVRTEPFEEKDEYGCIVLDGNLVIGEVRRGEEILHKEEIVTDDTIESVCDAKEDVGLKVELWAVKNTDFVPEEDCMPQ